MTAAVDNKFQFIELKTTGADFLVSSFSLYYAVKIFTCSALVLVFLFLPEFWLLFFILCISSLLFKQETDLQNISDICRQNYQNVSTLFVQYLQIAILILA